MCYRGGSIGRTLYAVLYLCLPAALEALECVCNQGCAAWILLTGHVAWQVYVFITDLVAVPSFDAQYGCLGSY
jgi:hypothetical protein